MNKMTKRIAAVGVCTALCVGGIAGHAYATSADNAKDVTNVKLLADGETEEKVEQLLSNISVNNITKENVVKDETVYVMTGADGSVSNVIVSDWLKNGNYEQSLKDISSLTNIENVKGDESFSDEGNGAKVWAAEGNDIYYTGNSEKQVPVSLKITYTLDGKVMTPAEMAGKSGKVNIKFEYENNEKTTVNIDGKEETVAVPFVALTGMLLDTDVFRNVEVTNGKLINDGSRMAVVGFAVPGLKDILEKDTIDLPDSFEISAEVTDFRFGMTVTVATNEVFNKLSVEGFDFGESLGGLGTQLTEAMTQLQEGSSQLYDGLDILDKKSGELGSGVNQLAAGSEALKAGAGQLETGINQLKDGAGQLDTGLGQLKTGAGELVNGIGQLEVGAGQVDTGAGELKAGMEELKNGLDVLTANNDALNSGAKQVFETLLANAENQLKSAGLEVPALTIENYGKVLDGVVASLDKDMVYKQAEATVQAAVEANRAMIVGKVTAAIREQVEGKVKMAIAAKMGEAALTTNEVQAIVKAQTEEQMKSEEVKALINSTVDEQIKAAVDENMKSAEVQAKLVAAENGAQTIANLRTSLDGYNTFYTGLNTYTGGVAAAAKGAEALSSGAAALKDGTSQLATGTSQLSEGSSTLTSGIDQLITGSSALVSGAGQLSEGAAALSTGAAQLDGGIDKLAENVPALVTGVGQLKEGAEQLKDGITKFNQEGIEKIVSVINDNLGSVIDKAKVIAEAAKQYNNYSGISEGMAGTVKFIYRTNEIK